MCVVDVYIAIVFSGHAPYQKPNNNLLRNNATEQVSKTPQQRYAIAIVFCAIKITTNNMLLKPKCIKNKAYRINHI